MSVAVPMAFAWAFLAIGRWGRRNADALVPAHLSPHRRDRERRALRRGALSCLALSFVCAAIGVLEATTLAVGG